MGSHWRGVYTPPLPFADPRQTLMNPGPPSTQDNHRQITA